MAELTLQIDFHKLEKGAKKKIIRWALSHIKYLSDDGASQFRHLIGEYEFAGHEEALGDAVELLWNGAERERWPSEVKKADDDDPIGLRLQAHVCPCCKGTGKKPDSKEGIGNG